MNRQGTARGAGGGSAEQRRGRLRIFLGYIAGVGKTYAMLDAGRQQQAKGVDVVVGCVTTHGREETDTLCRGLEFVPSPRHEHAGAHGELDLDAILARRPQLVLVDDLAHANPPGHRHPKRYQDVDELLDAGIHVYATLNIQHLESLNDIVAQIAGIVVKETIPDRVLEDADTEVVDLPIAELLHRFETGQVASPAQEGLDASKLLRPGNLNALRELTLRCAAERVDRQLRTYMEAKAIRGPWPVSERIMVCVSPNPLGERLVRGARRLATHLDAEWYAVYVATPDDANLSEAARDRVAQTLRLAEELGAKAITTSATSVVAGLIDYAHAHNINKIVAGKPLRPRWREGWQGSVVDQLIRRGQDIDVYVISSAPSARPAALSPQRPSGGRLWAVPRGYLWGIGIVGLITLLGIPLHTHMDPTNLVMFYLMGIVITALRWGLGPSIAAAVVSVLVFDVVFVPPRYTVAVNDAEYLLTFAGFFIVGIVISTLTARARIQAAAAREREEQAIATFELSSDLATAVSLEDIGERALRQVQQVFGAPAAIYLPTGVGLTPVHAGADFSAYGPDAAVVDWAYAHRQPAGSGTGTLPAVPVRALPLLTAHKTVGVLALRQAAGPLLPAHRRLLESFANQIALALERAQLADAAGELRLVQEREKFQSALLGSISHDLRTPLVTITGALSALQEEDVVLPPDAQRALVATAHEQAARLNQLVGNLLDMSRLEGGTVQVRRELCDIQDVVGAALERGAAVLAQHPVELDVPDHLPLVPLDFVLIVQVLANLLDNAAKYSPPHSPITIRARCVGSRLEIAVADRGRGIPPEELTRIFTKFYRVADSNPVVGTGLGLSICKGLVEAHGGEIGAANRPGGGSIFTVSLPCDAAPGMTGANTHE